MEKFWVGKSDKFNVRSVSAQYLYERFLTIASTSSTASFGLIVFDPILINQPYPLQDTSKARAYYVDKNTSPYCVYEDYHVMNGRMIISRFDLTNNIVSATFEFTTYNSSCGDTVKITDGRFDIGNITR